MLFWPVQPLPSPVWHCQFPCRLFSLAPTVSTFLAVPGDPVESRSTTPSRLTSVPSLPAEVVIRKARLFQVNWSTVRESEV